MASIGLNGRQDMFLQFGLQGGRRLGGGGRNGISEIPGDQRQCPGNQVAPIVGEVAVGPLNHGLVGKVSIGAKGDLPQQKISDRIRTEVIEQQMRIDHVAARFGHLGFVLEPPAVGMDPFRKREAGCQQKGRPIDGVKANDVLSHQLNLGRPVLAELVLLLPVAESDSREVAHQGVEPDIDDVVFGHGNGNAPLDRGAADGKVLETITHEANHFVATRGWVDELGMFFIEVQKMLLKGRQLEEIALLGNALGRALTDFTVRRRFSFRGKQVAGNAIPAGILALVNETVVEGTLEHLGGRSVVTLAGGANETVILHAEPRP